MKILTQKPFAKTKTWKIIEDKNGSTETESPAIDEKPGNPFEEIKSDSLVLNPVEEPEILP